MPLTNLFKNCGYYWSFTALVRLSLAPCLGCHATVWPLLLTFRRGVFPDRVLLVLAVVL